MANSTAFSDFCAPPVVQAPGDPQGMALWAGQGHRLARELPAGQLVEVLASELSPARKAMTARGSS